MTEKLSNDYVDRLIRAEHVEEAATELLTAVWLAVHDGNIPDRCRVADAALRLRDVLNPNWPVDSNWLPEEIRTELGQST